MTRTEAPQRTVRLDASADRTRRRIMVGAAAAIILIICVVLSILYGGLPIPLGQAIRSLVAGRPGPDSIVMRQIRLPRTGLGLLVGAALGTAGALMQGLTGNPLADAGLLGINAGASFAAVLAIYLLHITTTTGFIWFALIGAALATATIELIARRRGRRDTASLVLGGAVLASMLASGIAVILTVHAGNIQSFLFWEIGSLSGRTAATLWQVAPFAVAGLALGLSRGMALNALSLGEDLSRSLGVRAGRQEALIVTSVVLMAGSAVAAAGPIGFVGLAVPHLVRRFVGPDQRWVLPLSACAGASLLLLADTIGRIVIRPAELDVGILTAVIGAPVLVAVVRSVRTARS